MNMSPRKNRHHIDAGLRCLYSYRILEIGTLEFGHINITSKIKMFPMEMLAPRVLNDEWF